LSTSQLRHAISADLGQHLVDVGDLVVARRTGRIDHVQQQVRLGRRFERGMESGHQRMRQLADEANGIGKRRYALPPASHSLRVVVSRVANNWSAAKTPACVRALNRVDLPALV
jgi:hypothetical protein